MRTGYLCKHRRNDGNVPWSIEQLDQNDEQETRPGLERGEIKDYSTDMFTMRIKTRIDFLTAL